MKKSRLFLLAVLVLALLCTSIGVAEENLSQWAMEEPVKVSIMHRQNPAVISYAEGENEQNNVYFNAYRDQLGIELDYRIRAVDDEYNQKLTMAIASNDLPDMMLLPLEQYTQLAKAGKLWDMAPILEQYASELTLKNLNSDGGTMLEAGKVDGVLYGIPTGNAQRIPAQYLWVRQDWLTKLGMNVPTSFEEVVELARAFKNNDPDGNGVNDTWGLGISNVMANICGFGTIEGVANAFGGSILRQIWVENEDGTMTYMPTSKGTRDALEALAGMFAEGLINAEFGVTDETGVGEAVAAGTCGLFYGGDGISWGFGRDAIANNPECGWVCVNAPAVGGGTANAYSFIEFEYIYAVNKAFDHPEALVKLVNFNNDRINSPDATVESLAKWGVNPVSGINQCDYTFALLDPYLNKAIGYNTTIGQVFKGELAAEDLMPEAYRYYEGIKRYVDEGWDKTGSANPEDLTAFQYAMCWGPEFGSWTRYQELRDENKIIMSSYFGAPTKTMLKRWGTLEAMQEETFAKIIAGSEKIEAFDAFVEQWKALGGDTIAQEMAENFGTK